MITTQKSPITISTSNSEPDATQETEEEIYTTQPIETMMPSSSSYSTFGTTQGPEDVQESEKPVMFPGEESSTFGPQIDNVTLSTSTLPPIPSLEGVDYKQSKLMFFENFLCEQMIQIILQKFITFGDYRSIIT